MKEAEKEEIRKLIAEFDVPKTTGKAPAKTGKTGKTGKAGGKASTSTGASPSVGLFGSPMTPGEIRSS